MNKINTILNQQLALNSKSELFSWIYSFYPNIGKFSSENPSLQFDLYIPEIKMAIELNELIWHGTAERDDKNRFEDKMRLAQTVGIRVINIFDDEWRERNTQVKSFLLSAISKNSRTFAGRKCKIKLIEKSIANNFLESYHIQGSAKSDAFWGLYHKDELLAVMSGSKHHRQNQHGIFILNRLAFKYDVSVQGGSSKLLKVLIQFARENGYHKLLSWSDNRISEGRVYAKMGVFVLEEDMGSDYSYIKGNNRISKQSCQKKQLVKRGAIGGMEVTERTLAMSLGLYRIYDCGKKRWAMNL